jgi:hypothetical protein
MHQDIGFLSGEEVLAGQFLATSNHLPPVSPLFYFQFMFSHTSPLIAIFFNIELRVIISFLHSTNSTGVCLRAVLPENLLMHSLTPTAKVWCHHHHHHYHRHHHHHHHHHHYHYHRRINVHHVNTSTHQHQSWNGFVRCKP